MNGSHNESGLVTFNRPTFQRLLSIVRRSGKISVLRCLEYERLEQLELEGRVLDFGGGTKTNYSEQVAKWSKVGAAFIYESANIDPRTKPTFLLEPGAPLPCEEARYDTVLSFNTFEHIYDVTAVLHELNRVTKSGGNLIFIVPFIFRVHGHPSDFSRHTPAYWSEKLKETGFDPVGIEALHWGPFSVASTVTGLPGPFKKTRLRIALFKDFALSFLKSRMEAKTNFKQDHAAVNCPLGYFIAARRI